MILNIPIFVIGISSSMKKIVEDVESYSTTDDKFQLDSAYSLEAMLQRTLQVYLWHMKPMI